MRFLMIAVMIAVCGMCAQADAQCFAGSCRLPGRPVERIANLVRALPAVSRQARIQRDGWYFGKNFGPRARRDRGAWYPTKNIRRVRVFRRWR